MRSTPPSAKAVAAAAKLHSLPSPSRTTKMNRAKQPVSAGRRIWMVSRYAKQRSSVADTLAGKLGVPVKRVDLSELVSDYIGETEKNLSRVFADAEARDSLLFFDEADALFGKRTDVKDAHDRYGNETLNYFLEQLGRTSSPFVVATRRKQSMDPRWKRELRMSMMTQLPLPKVRVKKRQSATAVTLR
jgi:SpoVK/Ycf46/Vps4 family AAA+-type ATPase